MKTQFEQMMDGLNDVEVFLAGEQEGFKAHVPQEVGKSGGARVVISGATRDFRFFLSPFFRRMRKKSCRWQSATRYVLPLMVLTPSKPRLILPRIVGIKIDVQARYSAISKLEDVAETAAGSFAPCPRLTRHSAL